MGAASDGAEIVRLSKEHAELKPVADAVDALLRARKEAPDLEQMLRGGDADMAALAPEIARFEPMLALDGGPDGFGCYGDLAAAIARLLAPGGFAVVEIGSGQAIEVTEIFSALGLHARPVHRDLAGIERCLMLKRDAILTKN